MGVHGLWPLIAPCARPQALETLGGQRMAIDSSIWLYEFQHALRDKDGRALDNAHILGFLRRINKLLYYGIKAVFVFDGGAPQIKKRTIANRKNRKQGAKESAARTAEKLLAAQLRAAAVAQAQKAAQRKETGEAVEADNANYLDGDDYGIAPRGAPVRTRPAPAPAEATGEDEPPKKKKYVHRDQYALPVIEGPIGSNATGSDPRLATEAELRSFIEDMRPEDFDMDSDFFSNLPIDVKYEIIGDLRIKSRQANYRRVEAMKSAPTALDFSKAQILGLSHRNAMTQRLLTVTDSLSRVQAMSGTSVRIAGERNKEYVLIKNDSSTGAGYILGIRGEGKSKNEPVKIDATTTDESDTDQKGTTDEEFEAVDIPKDEDASGTGSGSSPFRGQTFQPHLQGREDSPETERRRKARAMQAIQQRYSPVKHTGRGRGDSPIDDLPVLPPQKPLFSEEQAEALASTSEQNSSALEILNSFQPDFDLWDALQQSVRAAEGDQGRKDEEADLQRAMEMSRQEQGGSSYAEDRTQQGTHGELDVGDESDVSFDEVETRATPEATAQPSPCAVMPSSARSTTSRRGVDIVTDGDLDNGNDSDHSVEYVRADPGASDLPQQATLSREVTATATNASKAQAQVRGRENKGAVEQRGARAAPPANANSPAKSLFTAIALSSSSEDDTSAPRPSSASVSTKKKPPGLHLYIPPEAYRPPSPEQEQNQQSRTPRPDLTDKQARRDTSPQLVQEHDGVIERDYAQQPDSPAVRSHTEREAERAFTSQAESAEVAQKAAQARQPAASRPSLMERTMSSHSLRSASPEEDGPLQPSMAADPAKNARNQSARTVSAVDASGKGGEETSRSGTSVQQVEAATSGSLDAGTQPSGMDGLDKGDLPEEATADVAGNPANQIETGAGSRDESPEVFYEWSQSPEPVARKRVDDPTLLPPDDPNYIPPELLAPDAGMGLSDEEPDNDEDAEQAANMTSEQREYAKFLSELTNKNLDEMEYEVQNELRTLNEQNKKDRALADDITQQMAKDIQTMLKVLGLPYVVAPMEAEAQCAELLHRKLVDGVITDDNDVFLFGATKVYKNMFNQNKYVECYLATDIDRELALDREKLIRLAHFLGSDYCDGLPGVGPVLGMELMAEFPGEDGLVEFRNWWLKVQRGRDTPADHGTAFRRKFKKSKRSLFLDEHWPNPEVAKSYMNPEVDKSDEAFAWGIPDLDALRDYLKDSLGWGPAKVDETMLPIIRRMTGRQSGQALNQSTMSSFFDVTGGTGRFAPMANSGYKSKRLQAVLKAWRASQRRLSKEEQGDESDELGDGSGDHRKAQSSDEDDSDAAAARARQTQAKGKGEKKSLTRPAAKRVRSGTKNSSSSRQSSKRPSQRGDSDLDEGELSAGELDEEGQDPDAAFDAELEARLEKLGVKRKREAPIGSDRIIKPAKRSKREVRTSGSAKTKAKPKGSAARAGQSKASKTKGKDRRASSEDDAESAEIKDALPAPLKEKKAARAKGKTTKRKVVPDDDDEYAE